MNSAEICFNIFNVFTTFIGGFFLVLVFILSIFCVLNALLKISDEYRSYFVGSSRAVGIIIAIFGLLLPFRQTVHPISTIAALWWCAFFNGFLPYFQLFQFIGLDIFSWIFWTHNLFANDDFEVLFMLQMGDFTIFVLLPTIFGLVMISKRYSSLDNDYKYSRNLRNSKQIPLGSFIGKLASWFDSVIPKN